MKYITLPESEFEFEIFNPDADKPQQVASFCPAVKTTHVQTGESVTVDTERNATANRVRGMEILTELIERGYMFCKEHGYVTDTVWDDEDAAYICSVDGCSRNVC